MRGKLKIALLRGCFANNYELQNYASLYPKFNLWAFTSQKTIENKLLVRSKKLFSLTDFPIPPKLLSFAANRSLGDKQILFGLEKELLNFSILHTADPHYYYSYQAAQVKKQHPDKILITTNWETITHNNEGTTAKKRLKDFVKEQTDIFLCYSQRAKKCLISEGVNVKKISQIYLGIDTEKFKPKLGLKKKVILFVGRLVEEKNPQLLLTAFQKISLRYPNYQLWFVGPTSPTGGVYGELAEPLGVSNSTTKVFSCSYSQMPSIYQQAEIFVLPSRRTKTWEEQYGMVLLEAMSSGLPIIGSRTGAIPEIVGADNLLFTDNQASALTRQLNFLLSRPKIRQKLAKINRERAVKIFNKKLFAQKIAQLYEKLNRHCFNP